MVLADPVAEPTLVLDKPFYSPHQVADIAGLSPATILNYIRDGKLMAIRLSERTIRIPQKSVLLLLDPGSARKPVFVSDPDAIVD
jgi:predicted site-specific integrase-resolvase